MPRVAQEYVFFEVLIRVYAHVPHLQCCVMLKSSCACDAQFFLWDEN